MMNKLDFFTKSGPVYSSRIANEMFKKKWDNTDLPIYMDYPINESLLRDTNKLYSAVIEGSERVVNLLQSTNVNFQVFAKFDDYLTVKPKIRNKDTKESPDEYEKMKQVQQFTPSEKKELKKFQNQYDKIMVKYNQINEDFAERHINKIILVGDKDNLTEYEESFIRMNPGIQVNSVGAMREMYNQHFYTTEELNDLIEIQYNELDPILRRMEELESKQKRSESYPISNREVTTYEKVVDIKNAIESGYFDDKITAEDVNRLFSDYDIDKIEKKTVYRSRQVTGTDEEGEWERTVNEKSEVDSNVRRLANIIPSTLVSDYSNEKYDAEDGNTFNQGFFRPFNFIVDDLSKVGTNMKVLNKLFEKIINKKLPSDKINIITKSIREIEVEYHHIKMYILLFQRILENILTEPQIIQNSNKLNVLEDIIDSELNKMNSIWENYLRTAN